MKVLWQRGEATVGDVLERLNAATPKDLAYNTVMSVMARLERKGILERERAGRAFVYRPVSSRDAFLATQASRAARQLLDEYGELGVAGFVQQVSDDPELRAEIDRLLRDAESEDR